MRLAELVSRLTPATFAEISLVIFLIVFAGVVISVLRRKNQPLFEAARSAPLDDGEPRKESP